MIEFRQTGDLFEEEMDALVNTVNCVGVMGRGIALQFKGKFPENFKKYVEACERGEVCPGKMFVHYTGQFQPRYIINFPTKAHWRSKSRIKYIELGLQDLCRVIKDEGIQSIAIPALGSDLGGLNWSEVRSLMEEELSELTDMKDLRIVIFEPQIALEAV